MKLIKELEELIEDEIHDVKKYAKMATALKEENPSLAQVLFNISAQEEQHQAAIHTEVVKIINEYKRTKGEPPATMMAVYEYIHKKHIDAMADARRYQDLYKTS